MNATKLSVSLIGLVCLCSTLNTYSQWNSDPAVNTPVCTTVTTNQFKSQLVADGSGGFFITWMEMSIDLSSGSIYAQHLSSTGTRLWAAEGINVNGSAGLFSDPQIVTDGNGGAIISWVLNIGGALRHYVQKISGNGQLQWTAGGVLVCPVTVTPFFYYKLISDNQGGAIVLWDDTRASNNQVYAQRIDVTGNLLWPVNGLPCTSNFTGLLSFNAVADSKGGVFISYSFTTNPLYMNEIVLQHITENGLTHWGQVGEVLPFIAGDQLFASLAVDSLDNAIVVWQDFRLDPVMCEIWGQRVSIEREIKWGVGGKMLVDSVVPQYVLAKIATDTSRGAIITWLDDFSLGQTTGHMFAIRIDSTGTEKWPKREIATYTAAQLPGEYELVPDFGSGAYLSWINASGVLSAQHIQPNGSTEFAISGKVVSTAPLFLQKLACDSNGVAVVAWTDLRSGTNYDAYAARISAVTALPVTWTDFSGKWNGTAVLLNWQTSDEENNKGYIIQRSSNGVRFDSIGFIEAANFFSLYYDYAFTDQHPAAGSNFYRLQQIDIDGKISYSRTIRLDVDIETGIKIFPNPASEWITVKGLKAGSFIGIYSSAGKKHRELRSNGTVMQVSLGGLPKGIYYIRIQQPGIEKTKVYPVMVTH